jgi:hypothetical protein
MFRSPSRGDSGGWANWPIRRFFVALMLVSAVLLAACGGNDEEEGDRANNAVTEQQVRALVKVFDRPKQSTKQAVFRRLGATPLYSHQTFSAPSREQPRRIAYTCYRFSVQGGRRGSFADLCFKDDRVLTYILSNVTVPGAATPPSLGP